MGITKLLLKNQEYDIDFMVYDGPELYEGRELSEYTWAQLKNSCKWGPLDNKVNIGDYKTITLTNGEIVKMQIAGIDTYFDSHDVAGYQRFYIDWISIDCLKDKVQWNTTDDNNGTSADYREQCPWYVSNVRNYLNNTIYPMIPTEVQNAIFHKIDPKAEKRYYSLVKKLTSSNGYGFYTLEDNLWIPNEYEVFGSTVLGTPIYSAGDCKQYPLFAHSWKHRSKNYNWWLKTPYDGDSTSCCEVVSSYCYVDKQVASYSLGVPLCFRVSSIIT